MRVTIVCPNDYIEVVRERAKLIVQSHLALTTPLPSDGNLPVTHWICTCYLTIDGLIKFNELREYSSIYSKSPKIVLKELNLKKIDEKNS